MPPTDEAGRDHPRRFFRCAAAGPAVGEAHAASSPRNVCCAVLDAPTDATKVNVFQQCRQRKVMLSAVRRASWIRVDPQWTHVSHSSRVALTVAFPCGPPMFGDPRRTTGLAVALVDRGGPDDHAFNRHMTCLRTARTSIRRAARDGFRPKQWHRVVRSNAHASAEQQVWPTTVSGTLVALCSRLRGSSDAGAADEMRRQSRRI